MSADAETALSDALIAALAGDAGVAAVLGAPARLYQDPPPQPIFPFATLGRVETTAADSADQPASQHALTVHVWARHGGREETSAAIAAIRARLHNAALTLSGHRLVLLLATFADVFRTADGRTMHGVLRLRAITEPLNPHP